MKSTLEFAGLTDGGDQRKRGYRGLIDLLVGLDPLVTFGIANSIWYRQGEDILEPFTGACSTYFDAPGNRDQLSGPGRWPT